MARGHGISAWLGGSVVALLTGSAAAGAPTVSPSGLIVFDIRDPARLAEISGSLQSDLVRLGLVGHVAACRNAVHLTTGRPDGNDYFGAVCGLVDHAGRRAQVVMCDDRIVGRFALKVTFAMSRDDVVRFTDANCTVGQ